MLFGDAGEEGGASAGSDQSSYWLSVRIVNLQHIVEAFGEETGMSLETAVHDRIVALLTDSIRIERNGWPALPVPLLEQIAQPVEYGGHVVMASVQVTGVSLDLADRRVDTRSMRERAAAQLDVGLSLRQPGRSRSWKNAYRKDMDAAVRLWRKSHSGHYCTGWQPIVSTGAQAEFLYQELHVRRLLPEGSRDGGDDEVEQAGPTLERLRLTQWFDLWLLRWVLEQLRETPFVRLGCVISAQTASAHGWLGVVIAELTMYAGLGARLVLGISGVQAGPALTQSLATSQSLKRCGVTIALCDVAMGCVPPGQAISIEPDVVKINGALLRWAHNDALLPIGVGQLANLIALAPASSSAVSDPLEACGGREGACLADDRFLPLRSLLIALPSSHALWGVILGIARWLA